MGRSLLGGAFGLAVVGGASQAVSGRRRSGFRSEASTAINL